MANDSSSPKLIVPAVAGLYEWGADMSYPLVRFFAGIILVPHGAQKLFEWFGGSQAGAAGFLNKVGVVPGEFWVIVLGGVEFFGGLLIAIGLLTRPAALGALIVMIVAIVAVNAGPGFFWNKGGYEYPLLWGIIFFAIFLKGGGKLSIDSKLGKEF
jgi:putative oxidoreductase